MSTAKKLIITDDEISQVLSLREMKKTLKAKLDKLDDQLKENENQLMELIECGCEIDSSFTISINETQKVYPKYKEEIEKRLGEKVLKEIIRSTAPKAFKKLVIK